MPRFSPRRASRRSGPRPLHHDRTDDVLQTSLDADAYRQRPLQPDEIRWARELWEHREPASEIAKQLDVDIVRIEALIAGWNSSPDEAPGRG